MGSDNTVKHLEQQVKTAYEEMCFAFGVFSALPTTGTTYEWLVDRTEAWNKYVSVRDRYERISFDLKKLKLN